MRIERTNWPPRPATRSPRDSQNSQTQHAAAATLEPSDQHRNRRHRAGDEYQQRGHNDDRELADIQQGVSLHRARGRLPQQIEAPGHVDGGVGNPQQRNQQNQLQGNAEMSGNTEQHGKRDQRGDETGEHIIPRIEIAQPVDRDVVDQSQERRGEDQRGSARRDHELPRRHQAYGVRQDDRDNERRRRRSHLAADAEQVMQQAETPQPPGPVQHPG